METQPSRADECLIYASSAVGGKSPTMHLLSMNARTGALKVVWSAKSGDGGATNPTHLALDARRRRVYASDQVRNFSGVAGGAVHAYAVEPGTGVLTPLGGQPAGDSVPCYVALTTDGQHLLSAGYGEGTLAMFPLDLEGKISPRSCLVSHADVARAPHARAHSVLPDPTGKLLMSPDLGVDRIVIHRSPPPGDCAGTLTPHLQPFCDVPLKSGPRHLAWHPNGKLLFVMTEYSNRVLSFAYDAVAGTLKLLQEEPALPADFTAKTYGADIAVHPGGRFLYATNRGHESVVAMSIEPETGAIHRLDNFPSGGKFPQVVRIDPAGRFLLVCNMHADNITTFAIDPATGRLAAQPGPLALPRPSCLVFVP